MSPLVTCMALNKLQLKRVNYFLREFDLIYPPFFWKAQMSKMLTSKKLVIFQKLTKFKERILAHYHASANVLCHLLFQTCYCPLSPFLQYYKSHDILYNTPYTHQISEDIFFSYSWKSSEYIQLSTRAKNQGGSKIQE